MSPSQHFLDLVERHGYDFFAGVPCSLLEGVLGILDTEPRYGYVSAVREDSAIGIAAGAWFGGRQPVVFMQNSGLGVSTNALITLNQLYDIPVLLVVSWRGQGGPGGERSADAPETLMTGATMEAYLDLLKVPFTVFDPSTLERDVETLTRTMRETRRPVALVVPKGMLQR